jgi:hypothetical protein
MAIAETATGILASLKALSNVAKTLQNVELREKLIDVQEQAMDLMEQNATLKTQIADLRDTKAVRAELMFENNVYWRGTRRNDVDGPYCIGCFDGEGALVHLVWLSPRITECPHCKRMYNLDGRRPI